MIQKLAISSFVPEK